MSVLECADKCGSVVEANRCCGNMMSLSGEKLHCASCKKEVMANRCCGKPMKEKKM
ncbi:hypothetical protein HY988_05720 [Candidatus Micrarchaeota archaeon]|nr:hypothetical protein [Candidatus Micrarchaeota archaeon]